jgi:glucose-6-phosphate 1-epimerase
LTHDAATAGWPHAFGARLHIGLADASLEVTLEIRNEGPDAFAFTAALHTYLAVGSLEAVSLHGLEGCGYEDSTGGGALHTQADEALRFDGEVDRIYAAPSRPVELVDGPRRLAISQHGFPDTVVWNPGERLAATIGDLAPGDHTRFVCVEAALAGAPLVLAPGAYWSGTQRLA